MVETLVGGQAFIECLEQQAACNMDTKQIITQYVALADQTRKAEKNSRLLREQADGYKKQIVELCKVHGALLTDEQKATITEIQVAGFTVAPRVRYDVSITAI